MAMRVGWGKIWLGEFDGPTLKPPYRHKDLSGNSYRIRVIANFVPYFVVMATGVGQD